MLQRNQKKMDPIKFNSLEEKIHQERTLLDEKMQILLSEMPNPSVDAINSASLQGANFFTKFESFLASISSDSESLSKTQVEDVLATIESVLDYAVDYWDVLKEQSKNVLSVVLEPEHNFLKTAQLIFKTHKQSEALILKNKYQASNLPVVGFESKGSFKLNSIKIDWVSLIIGVVLLALSGLLVFSMNIDTGMKYLFSRVLISLSIALIFTGVAKEKIQAKFNLSKMTITTGGTVAIFFVIYFANPAEIPVLG